jgi:hypothetical protein
MKLKSLCLITLYLFVLVINSNPINAKDFAEPIDQIDQNKYNDLIKSYYLAKQNSDVIEWTSKGFLVKLKNKKNLKLNNDKPDQGFATSYYFYRYIKEYDYLVFEVIGEDWFLNVVDLRNGQQYFLLNYPCLSADKNKILTVFGNEMDYSGLIRIYDAKTMKMEFGWNLEDHQDYMDKNNIYMLSDDDSGWIDNKTISFSALSRGGNKSKHYLVLDGKKWILNNAKDYEKKSPQIQKKASCYNEKFDDQEFTKEKSKILADKAALQNIKSHLSDPYHLRKFDQFVLQQATIH